MINKKTYTSWQKDTVYSRYNGRCAICGKPVTRKDMTISHKIPLSRGGDNGMDNLMLSCWECNHAKNNLTMEEFLKRLWQIFLHNEDTILELVNNK